MPAAEPDHDRQRDDVNVTAEDLLDFEPEAPITEAGLRHNITSASSTSAPGWPGNGCVPIFNLMEDAATAEISRSQIWQWIRSPKGVLDDGRKVTKDMVAAMIPEEMRRSATFSAPRSARASTTKRRRSSPTSSTTTASSNS